jgi:trehalose-6-phosphate synthase
MELAERQERQHKLLAVVSRTTATTWAEDFLEALTACR